MLAGASAITLLIARFAALCAAGSGLCIPSELKKMSTMSCGASAESAQQICAVHASAFAARTREGPPLFKLAPNHCNWSEV